MSDSIEMHASVAAGVRAALHRGRRVATTSALGLSMVLSASAIAQTATDNAQSPADTAATEVEEVVVTGIRQQLESSQARKQDAEENRRFGHCGRHRRAARSQRHRSPAANSWSGHRPRAAARDADRIAVEGSGATIRGLSWVRSELNGRSAFSAKNAALSASKTFRPS